MTIAPRISVYQLGYYVGTAEFQIPDGLEEGRVVLVQPTGVSLQGVGSNYSRVARPPDLTPIRATVRIVVFRGNDPGEVERRQAIEVDRMTDAMRLPGWKRRK